LIAILLARFRCEKFAPLEALVVVQFDCHPEQAAFCAARDLGEPRQASRFLRRINGAFGSLPFQTAPLPTLSTI